MKKTVWSIGVAALLFLKTEAQPIQLGVVYGQGASDLKNNLGFTDNQMAYHIGLWLAYPKTKHFSILTGLNYQSFQSKGTFNQSNNMSNPNGEVERYLNLHLLNIPIELDYYFKHNNSKPFLGAGAALGTLLHASTIPAFNSSNKNITASFQSYTSSIFVIAGIEGKLSSKSHYRAAFVLQQSLLSFGSKGAELSTGMYRVEVGVGFDIY